MILAADTVVDDKFRIIKPLGTGGMGSVFVAEQIGFARIVALKILSDPQMADEDSYARFLREAQVISKLHHKNIVSVYAFGKLNDVPYLAMELVQGESLASVLFRERKLGLPRAIRLASQVCSALEHAHQSGIIHRDIKPANVIVTGKDEVKVIDFGLAKMVQGADSQQRLTQEGTAIGSVLYMSPEQCLGEIVDGRTDLYSLGCVLFHCITGAPPYDEDNPVTVMYKHLNGTAPHLVSEGENEKSAVSQLQSVLDRAMSKSREDRYATAEELRADLDALLSALPDSACVSDVVVKGNSAEAVPKRTNTAYALIALSILLLGALTISYLQFEKSSRSAAIQTAQVNLSQGQLIKQFEQAKGIEKLRVLKDPRARQALSEINTGHAQTMSSTAVSEALDEALKRSKKEGDIVGRDLAIEAFELLDYFPSGDFRFNQKLRCCEAALRHQASLPESQHSEKLNRLIDTKVITPDILHRENLRAAVSVGRHLADGGDWHRCSQIFHLVTPLVLKSNTKDLRDDSVIAFAQSLADHAQTIHDTKLVARVLAFAEEIANRTRDPQALFLAAQWCVTEAPDKTIVYGNKLLGILGKSDEPQQCRVRHLLAQAYLRKGDNEAALHQTNIVLEYMHQHPMRTEKDAELRAYVIPGMLRTFLRLGLSADLSKLLVLVPPNRSQEFNLVISCYKVRWLMATNRYAEARAQLAENIRETQKIKVRPSAGTIHTCLCAALLAHLKGDDTEAHKWWQQSRTHCTTAASTQLLEDLINTDRAERPRPAELAGTPIARCSP